MYMYVIIYNDYTYVIINSDYMLLYVIIHNDYMPLSITITRMSVSITTTCMSLSIAINYNFDNTDAYLLWTTWNQYLLFIIHISENTMQWYWRILMMAKKDCHWNNGSIDLLNWNILELLVYVLHPEAVCLFDTFFNQQWF